MITAALIVAAGRGSRAATAQQPPKQYQRLGSEMMLTRTLRAFAVHEAVAPILTVIAAGDEALYQQAAKGLGEKLIAPAYGGATRQASVLAGLRALTSYRPDRVLIHDAARPFISKTLISAVCAALDKTPGAIAALPVADTLKRGEDGRIAGTLDRAGLWRAQTPQGFDFAAIYDAHERAALAGADSFTDDASIGEWAGLEIALVPGTAENWKITTAEDIALAERLLAPLEAHETRTGTGFDVHRFAPGDGLMLCGVAIPHDRRLEGHSDADVGLHALTDALLGTIAAGDIGSHFPPSDPAWKGAASDIFLRHAASLVAARGGQIIHADLTLICERPKIGPYREQMRVCVAGMLGLDKERISIKATTTEGLGFTGRGEGIAALASASVRLPAPGDNKERGDAD